MKPRTGPVWIILGCSIILLTIGVATLGVNAYRVGMLVVRVQDSGPHGTDLAIRVPAILVPMAMRIIPDEPLRRAARDAARWTPAVRSMVKVLSDSPDFLLVHIDSPRETVKIQTKSHNLVVDVTSVEEKVYLSVPLTVLGAVMRRLEGVVANS
jgi:hypothetical protein